MVKQPTDYFEALLGINAPWFIQHMERDDKNKIVKIDLGYQPEKVKFSFFGRHSDHKQQQHTQASYVKRWTHTPLGHYTCQISSAVFDAAPDNQTAQREQGIPRDSLLQPHFLGDAQRSYTHQLRQQVTLANARGLANDAIARSLAIPQPLVDEILLDVEKTPSTLKLAMLLPTAADPIWEDVVCDRVQIKTQSMPLRLFLSKLKLNIIDPKSTTPIHEAIADLRKFFIAHINQLEAEISQICAINIKKATIDERQASATKLVLPALKNSIWLKIITGKLELKSTNMPLNLFLVRLRHAFNHAEDSEQRIHALSSLREFFRKNARSLKKELMLINQWMNQPEQPSITLPDEKSDVWQRILKDDSFIPSSHIAYKLLLSNLRSQLLMNPNPVVELNAARRLRDFINHNQRMMPQELRMVVANSRAY